MATKVQERREIKTKKVEGKKKTKKKTMRKKRKQNRKNKTIKKKVVCWTVWGIERRNLEIPDSRWRMISYNLNFGAAR